MLNRLEYVRVKFLGEYNNHPIDSTMSMLRGKAEELQIRGVLVILDLQNTANKSVDFPPMNKMVEAPEVKKTIRKGRNKPK